MPYNGPSGIPNINALIPHIVLVPNIMIIPADCVIFSDTSLTIAHNMNARVVRTIVDIKLKTARPLFALVTKSS